MGDSDLETHLHEHEKIIADQLTRGDEVLARLSKTEQAIVRLHDAANIDRLALNNIMRDVERRTGAVTQLKVLLGRES
jgi:Xaa-Pro aminopeptidase